MSKEARVRLKPKRPQRKFTEMSEPALGTGLYSLQGAASYTRLPVAKVRRWVLGHDYRDKHGAIRSPGPVVKHHLPPIEGRIALTFRDLIEVYWVRTLLDSGISMYTIRRAAEEAEEILKSDHPFCQAKFAHDGADIFARLIDDKEREHILQLTRRQFVFREVVAPLLKELEYAEKDRDGVLRWWPLGRDRNVVIDPGRAFGAATIAGIGVPTLPLYESWRAERDISTVAKWYDVPESAVRDAIEFEDTHHAPL